MVRSFLGNFIGTLGLACDVFPFTLERTARKLPFHLVFFRGPRLPLKKSGGNVDGRTPSKWHDPLHPADDAKQ